MLSEPLLVVARLARTFDDLAIRYLVGGSLASSIYGTPRATQDVDLVAELEPDHVEPLTGALADEFYIDAGMIRDAIRRRRSFNVVHLATMFKADVFVSRGDAWSREEMARARTGEFDTPDGKLAIRFASPEDTLLHKFLWYQLGNQVSDRQWGDVAGVLKMQADSLDREYLRQWADSLGVSDLLARAMREVAEQGPVARGCERPRPGAVKSESDLALSTVTARRIRRFSAAAGMDRLSVPCGRGKIDLARATASDRPAAGRRLGARSGGSGRGRQRRWRPVAGSAGTGRRAGGELLSMPGMPLAFDPDER